MFTTEHYQAIANVLAAHVPTDDLRDGDVCLRRVGDALAQMFANDNDRFKRALFLAAAGFAPDEDAGLDFGARYAVVGYPGVAFRLVRHPLAREQCQGHDDGDNGRPSDHGIGQTWYCDGTCQQEEPDESRVIAVMVGDDREHVIDVDDLIALDEDAYCRECGQIGCGHGRVEG